MFKDARAVHSCPRARRDGPGRHHLWPTWKSPPRRCRSPLHCNIRFRATTATDRHREFRSYTYGYDCCCRRCRSRCRCCFPTNPVDPIGINVRKSRHRFLFPAPSLKRLAWIFATGNENVLKYLIIKLLHCRRVGQSPHNHNSDEKLLSLAVRVGCLVRLRCLVIDGFG